MQRKEIQPKERQPRNSSIELLRIAAMIFIVLSHACYHIQFYARTSVLVVACAIGMFLFAVNCPAFSNNRINAISGCTFGVYLIHENPAVRDILWSRVFKLADSLSAPFLVGKIIASVVIVFCVCIAIEYMRLRFLGKYFDRVSMRLENLIIEAGRWIQKDRTRSKNKDAVE